MDSIDESSWRLTPIFPDDITLQILIRLPAKSLVRFTCVSKPWYYLVFSDRRGFVRAHLRRQLAEPLLMASYWSIGVGPRCRTCNLVPDRDSKAFAAADSAAILPGPRHPFFHLGDRMMVVSCLDGLFCMLKDCHCNSDLKLYLWNPALRQCVLLPRRMGIGYYTVAVGSGFDVVSQDYKVAKVYSAQVIPEDNVIYRVDVYSLKNHSWTTLLSSVSTPPQYSYTDFRAHTGNRNLDFSNCPRQNRACVIHNGCLYWIWARAEGGPIIGYCIRLSGGDNGSWFALPECITIEEDPRLRLYRGRLAVFGSNAAAFELWVMGESIDEWTKQFAIPVDSGIRPVYCMTDITAGGKVLAYDLAEGRHQDSRVEGGLGRLVLYDPESRDVEIVRDRVRTFYYKYYVIDNYVESLLSVVPAREKAIQNRRTRSFPWISSLFGYSAARLSSARGR